jgi:hypothetical protein
MFELPREYELLNMFNMPIYIIGLVNKKNGQAAERSPDLRGIRNTNILLYHDSVNNNVFRSAIM